MVNKHCCYNLCKSDSRYHDRPHMKDVSFVTFPKKIRHPLKCAKWVEACGRPKDGPKKFTVDSITKDTYICTKHFVGGQGPTLQHPDPIPAVASEIEKRLFELKKKRPAPKHRFESDVTTSSSKKRRPASSSTVLTSTATGQEGLTSYNGMESPADHCVDNFTAFGYHFLGKTNETYERYVFNKRDQKADEAVEDYVAALRTLASTCNFCDCLKDTLLRDRIVSGIKDGSARERLLQEADLTLETCIAMCHAAEATSPSQPVKTVTWTEDTTAVQAGSVSSGDQRPGKKKEQDFPGSLRHSEAMAPPDELEMSDSEVNFSTEGDDSDDDSALQWTTELQSSGFPRNGTEHIDIKHEPAWSMEGNSEPDQPSAVYSTAQPMSDNPSLLPLNTSHECYHCSAAFVLVSSLELHLASVHGEKLHIVLPESFTPDRCDAGSCNSSDVDKEVDSLGNRKTTTKRKITGGENGSSTSGPHVCDVCSKSFNTGSRLKRHILTHSGVKAFACDMCSKSFAEAGKLKRHKLTHSDHKPYVCDVCKKRFTRADELTRHVRVHSRERPFRCGHCGRDFKWSGDWLRHIKTVHGHRPNLCHVCVLHGVGS